MAGTRCQTVGCYQLTTNGSSYCLACRLDLGWSPARAPGRPRGTFERVDGYSSRCARQRHAECIDCTCDCHHEVTV